MPEGNDACPALQIERKLFFVVQPEPSPVAGHGPVVLVMEG